MKKVIFLIVVFISLVLLVAAEGVRGVLRPDLEGKLWRYLPPTQYPGFTLPLSLGTMKKYSLIFFEMDFEKYIVTINELPNSGDQNDAIIVSAVDFSALKKGEIPEQDCYYKGSPLCQGRVCDGLLIGVIDQSVHSKDGTYLPMEVWEITLRTLKFKKVSPKNVICKPQSYSE